MNLIKKFVFSAIFHVLMTGVYILTQTKAISCAFFKLIYIEILCGYSRKNKIIEALNSLQKTPAVLTICFEHQFQGMGMKQKEYEMSLSKMIDLIDTCCNVNKVNKVNIYVTPSKTENTAIETVLQEKFKSYNLGNKIHFLQNEPPFANKLEKTSATAPLVMVMSKYKSVLSLHPQYVVDAELAFLPVFSSVTNYDLLKAFQQYEKSKQRNGK